MTNVVVKPWFKEPWPWLLMIGPGIVVIAGVVTAIIAVKTNDGLVTEDYYKKGLAVNQTIAQSEKAVNAGVQAGIRITSDTLTVRLSARDKSFLLPPTLVATISHPTRAGLDQTRILVRNGDTYNGEYRLPAAGHWLILLEDEVKSWRLLGNVVLPASGETLIGDAASTQVKSGGAEN